MSDEFDNTSEVTEIEEVADTVELSPATEIPEVEDNSQPQDGLDTQTDFQTNTDLQIQHAVDVIQEMENLDPSVWQSLDTEARLDTLQALENRMAEIQGRPEVAIRIDDTLNENVFGGYDGLDISINQNHLNSDMAVDEFINTIVHEGRHAYQDYATRNPGFLSDEATVNSWIENNDFYLDPELYGQELYANQPVEADAFSYADRISNSLIARNWELAR